MKVKRKNIIVVLLILLSEACVDRLNLESNKVDNFPITITGSISDQQGPFEIKVRRSFAVGGASTYEAPVSVKNIAILDNQGNQETLNQTNPGIYRTSNANFKGTVGRSYKVRVELLDGKIYESVPDTIVAPTKLDTVFSKYRTFSNLTGGKEFFFDIFFNAYTSLKDNFYFLWKFRATYKVKTNPELELEQDPKGSEPCSFVDIDCAGCSVCNIIAKCTGLRNIGSPTDVRLVALFPCTCCTCWYTIYNERPIIASYAFIKEGRFENFKVGTIKLDDYILASKIYVHVEQINLSRSAYLFYKSIQDQKDGATSLFQPPSGTIPTNFRQLNGNKEVINGFFYAASVSEKVMILTKDNVPKDGYPFKQEPLPLIKQSCLKVYPNATTIKPIFWVD